LAGGAWEREHRAHQRAAWAAWHGAAFGRAKKMPKLKEFLEPAKAPAKGIDEVAIKAAFTEIIAKQKGTRRSGKDR
jgi:hypothetical protein